MAIKRRYGFVATMGSDYEQAEQASSYRVDAPLLVPQELAAVAEEAERILTKVHLRGAVAGDSATTTAATNPGPPTASAGSSTAGRQALWS